MSTKKQLGENMSNNPGNFSDATMSAFADMGFNPMSILGEKSIDTTEKSTEKIEVKFDDNKPTDIPVTVKAPKLEPELVKKITAKKLPQFDITKFKDVQVTGFDLREQIALVGYHDLNYGIHLKGKEAVDVLIPLWDKYKFLDCQNGYYRQPLRIRFADKREDYVVARKAKVTKVHKNGIKQTLSKTEYQVQKRKLYVPNDRGSDLGLPSQNTYGNKTTLKGTIVDYSIIIECYIGDTLLYKNDAKEYRQEVQVLGSQAINQNTGKSREHKDGGYPSVRKRTSTKMSTGTRITNDMNVWVDTRTRSKSFNIAGSPHPYQVQVLPTGNILLNQYQLGGYSGIATIGKVLDYYLSTEVKTKDEIKSTTFKYCFNWSFYEQWDEQLKCYKPNIWDKPEVRQAIDSLLNGKRSVPNKLLELYKDSIEYGLREENRLKAIEANKQVQHIPVGKVKKTRNQQRRDAKLKRRAEREQNQ